MSERRKALNSEEILTLLHEGYEIRATQHLSSGGTPIGLSQQWMQKPGPKKPADAPTVHWSSYLALKSKGEIKSKRSIRRDHLNILRWGLA